MTLASGGAGAEAEAVRPPSRESVSGGSGGGGFAGGVISGFSGAKFVAIMRQIFSFFFDQNETNIFTTCVVAMLFCFFYAFCIFWRVFNIYTVRFNIVLWFLSKLGVLF